MIRSDSIPNSHSLAGQAADNRDALAKVVYDIVFNYIVHLGLQDVAKCCKRRTPGVGDIQEVQVLQIRHSVTFSCRRYLDDDPSQQVQHGMETQWRHNESMCKWFQIKMKQISPK